MKSKIDKTKSTICELDIFGFKHLLDIRSLGVVINLIILNTRYSLCSVDKSFR